MDMLYCRYENQKVPCGWIRALHLHNSGILEQRKNGGKIWMKEAY